MTDLTSKEIYEKQANDAKLNYLGNMLPCLDTADSVTLARLGAMGSLFGMPFAELFVALQNINDAAYGLNGRSSNQG